MQIVNQSGTAVYEVENAMLVTGTTNAISGYATGRWLNLGEYATKEEAEKAFKKLLQAMYSREKMYFMSDK